MDWERIGVGEHDGFEVFVVGVQSRCGDGPGFEGLLDRGGYPDHRYDRHQTIDALLRGLRSHDRAVRMNAVVAYRSGLANLTVVVIDV